jgi:hypothetical protein
VVVKAFLPDIRQISGGFEATIALLTVLGKANRAQREQEVIEAGG